MTTGIVILVVIAALVGLGVLWDWRRSGRWFCIPIPRPYRNRGSQEAAWRDRCGERLGAADAVLTMLCDAFSFNPDDRYRFGPDDRIMDIYRACYPRWKVCDDMEIESLMMDVDEQYGLEVEDWDSDTTLGDLAELAAKRHNPATT